MSKQKIIQYVVIAVAVIATCFLLLYQFKQFNYVIERPDSTNDWLRDHLHEQLQKQNDLQKKLDDTTKENEQLKAQISQKKAASVVVASKTTQTSSKSTHSGCNQYAAEVKKYPWDANIALAIMRAESGCNPTTVSHTNDHGLFQIHKGLQTFGKDIYNPAFNVKLAYEGYYKKHGWKPWSAYKNGSYKKYL